MELLGIVIHLEQFHVLVESARIEFKLRNYRYSLHLLHRHSFQALLVWRSSFLQHVFELLVRTYEPLRPHSVMSMLIPLNLNLYIPGEIQLVAITVDLLAPVLIVIDPIKCARFRRILPLKLLCRHRG